MRIRLERGKRKGICKCGNPIEEERKGQRYCRDCHNAHMRDNRKKHKELTEHQKKKANCRSYLNVYVKRGKIVKMPCEVCGSLKVEAHHEDYNKPLEVRWFCRKHHKEHEKKY